MLKLLKDLKIKNEKQLNFLCYGKKRYRSFNLHQKNGKIRKIDIPCKHLKYVQRRILKKILYKQSHKIPNQCTGFMQGKSIINNGNYHLDAKTIINIDIKDFFPSITREMTYYIFNDICGYNQKKSSYLSKLTTYKNYLPQGSPSSPMISNLIGVNIDKRIIGFLEKLKHKGYSYSRYADDITVGFTGRDNPSRLVSNIYDIIDSEGFQINYNKTKILGKGQRKTVTGLIVNSGKCTIGRKKIKKYRAVFDCIKKKGFKKANNIRNVKHNKYYTESEFKMKLIGRLSFIKPMYPQYYQKYITLFKN